MKDTFFINNILHLVLKSHKIVHASIHAQNPFIFTSILSKCKKKKKMWMSWIL